MIITISRQYGAGGSEVARRVAELIGWTVIDNEVIDRVAERAGLSTEEVALHDERAPGFGERLARALAISAPELATAGASIPAARTEEHLARITESVVAELAQGGRVILVGRAAPAVLGRRSGTIHVKLVAPLSWRTSVISRRLNVDLRGAERAIDDTDANRMRYHRQYYNRDWNDPCNYDMILNTESLGYDEAADVVAGRARWRWPQATRTSHPPISDALTDEP